MQYHMFTQWLSHSLGKLRFHGTLAMGTTILSIPFAGADVANEDRVVVTASRAPQSISDIPQTVQVIEAEEIETQLATGATVADILGRLIPGMGTSSQIVNSYSQTIRGRRILLLIDGVPQVENRAVGRQLNAISPDSIERIEVVSGATAVYGAGGSGGVINIITKTPDQPGVSWQTNVGVAVNTNEPSSDSAKYTLGQSMTYGKDAWSLYINAYLERRNGLFDADGDRIAPEPAQSGREDTDTTDLFVKLGYQLNDDQKLTFSAERFRDDMDTDYGPNYGPGAAYVTSGGAQQFDNEAVDGLRLDDQPYSHRDAFSLSFADQSFFGGSLHWLGYHREREYKFYPFPLLVPVVNQLAINHSESSSSVWGSKVVFDRALTDVVNVTAGLDYETEKGEQTAKSYDPAAFVASNGLNYVSTGREYDYGPDVETETAAAFAQLKYNPMDKLTLSGGVRFESISQEISTFTSPYETLIDYGYEDLGAPDSFTATPLEGGTVEYQARLLNAGLIYELTKGQEFFAHYSEGYELPDTARLLRGAISEDSQLVPFVGGFTVIDDIKLRAIKVKSYELGWRGYGDFWYGSVTGFANVSDQTSVFNADYSVSMLDQTKEIYGVEAATQMYFGNHWSTGLTYTHTEGRTKDEDSGEWLGLDSSEVAPRKVTSFISYNANVWDVRLQSLTLFDYRDGEVYDEDTDSTEVSKPFTGYVVYDLIGSAQLPVGKLSAGVSNLFNRDYQTVYSQWAEATYGSPSGIPAQGRSLVLSYQVNY